jgi:hypothetical protein
MGAHVLAAMAGLAELISNPMSLLPMFINIIKFIKFAGVRIPCV